MKRIASVPRIAAAALSFVVLGCASGPSPVAPTWVPPPRAAGCSEATPCNSVRKWLEIEKEAAEAWPACHPRPAKGNADACARAEDGYARAHADQLDYFTSMCSGSVGAPARSVFPYLGVAESDRVTTCGGRGGTPAFTCRLWEWTWATSRKGGAFVVFLVQPEGAPQGTWVLNGCSYCETGAPCQELHLRR